MAQVEPRAARYDLDVGDSDPGTAANSVTGNSPGLVARTGGAALAALFGASIAVTNPLAGAVIGAASVPILEQWLERCRSEFRRRGEVLAESASLTSGIGQEEVVERLLASDELQPLVARVLNAAYETSSTDTLRLLGGVLGEAASGRPRRVNEDLMLVDGIRGLEPGHIRLLEQLQRPADASNPDVSWGIERIAQSMGDALSPVGLQAAIGGLLGRGLIQRSSGLDGGGYRITEFGDGLLGALRRSTPS